MNIFDEVRQLTSQAAAAQRAVDNNTGEMVRILKGRLRHTPHNYQNLEALKALKKELRDFNAVTGKWKT